MCVTNRFRSRGFTLVEMLVVIGIIAVLVALLMPAVMAAVNSGRRTRMATELAQLKDAIEKYKNEKGDYPPNLRGDPQVVLRHIRRCYPRISANDYNLVFTTDMSGNLVVRAAQQLDEGESLVFWLSKTCNSPQFPFTGVSSGNVKYYDFPEQRLVDEDGDGNFSFRPEYAKDSFYLYVDARSYYWYIPELVDPMNSPNPCYAESSATLFAVPYWSETVANTNTMLPLCQQLKPMEATTYQILCAGQDGEFGYDPSAPPTEIKMFPSGANYSRGDRDNLTSFSGGRKLDDHIP
jgi:prepilin-type N-terminal cleavage/methylation domain-containing protein